MINKLERPSVEQASFPLSNESVKNGLSVCFEALDCKRMFYTKLALSLSVNQTDRGHRHTCFKERRHVKDLDEIHEGQREVVSVVFAREHRL